MPIHSVLECLAPIDKDNRHFIVESLSQFWIGVNIHLAPLEIGISVTGHNYLLDDIAEMTSFA